MTKANETMNMMELNEEQLEAVTGGSIVDLSDIINKARLLDIINKEREKLGELVNFG